MGKIGIVKISLVAALALVQGGCGNPAWLAYRLNEKGISSYEKKEYGSAAGYFEKSVAQRFREEIPLYNLANNYYAEGNFPMAHKYYEKAMVLKPDYGEALFNDGHSLYRWGMSLLDKNYCNIERTLSLWEKSMGRFADASGVGGPSSGIGVKSEVIEDFIRQRMDFIKSKHRENRDICKKQKGKKGESERNKNKGKKGGREKDPSGGTGGSRISSAGSGGEKTSGKDRMTSAERERITGALKRIKRDSGKYRFNQTRTQQLRRGKGRQKIGEIISW